MSTPKFTRTIEDFICQQCGQKIKGNGYTNHCPFCLWSKHVDINPGDRAAECGGLMKPVVFDVVAGKYYVTHRCLECGFSKRNRLSENDDLDVVVALMSVFNK